MILQVSGTQMVWELICLEQQSDETIALELQFNWLN